jgi:hypothetical protein
LFVNIRKSKNTKMKMIAFISLLLLSLPFRIYDQKQNETMANNPAFKAGEELKYEMSYGWITGGVASLSLQKTKYQGKEVFHVKAVGKTIGIAHSLYNVKDVYESYFDLETGKPYKSIMDLKEGDYRNYNEVVFNHEEGTLVSNKSGKKSMGKDVFDIVSAFYYFRNNMGPIKVGDKVTIHTYFHDEPWDLVVRYKGNETIKTSLGKINCMKFKPVVEKGTFENEDALDIWISNDQNRIPICVKMKFFVGSFKTELVKHSGLVYTPNFIK